MIVNFEFLGIEPIDNVITCMNFKVDKVVFFGYHDLVEEYRDMTEEFLKTNCGVKDVVFQEVSRADLPALLKSMRRAIDHEKKNNNQIYFDITGGESLILVDFGFLAKEYGARIHYYDVENNRLVELESKEKDSISRSVSSQKIKFSVDSYIKLRGGKVNYNLHKKVKNIDDRDFGNDVAKIWGVSQKYWNYWNPFSMFLQQNLEPDEMLSISIKEKDVERMLAASNTKLNRLSKFNEILNALHSIGAIKKLERTNGNYQFTIKSQQVKDCLWDGGSILELYTYQKERRTSDDCRVGVHIDWDGIIHGYGEDVLNEVDVLVMRENIPVFMSCKSGKLKAQESLHALYELETVTERFGGKYAKKVLVTTRPLGPRYMERAAEMGIEVRQEG